MIFKGDCLDFIRELPPNSIDVCLTDPPYGIDFQSAWRTEKLDWKPKILNDESPFIDWIQPVYDKMTGGGGIVLLSLGRAGRISV